MSEKYNLEFDTIPSLVYVQHEISDNKKSFEIYKNGKKLTNINEISIVHNNEICTLDMKRKVGFFPL